MYIDSEKRPNPCKLGQRLLSRDDQTSADNTKPEYLPAKVSYQPTYLTYLPTWVSQVSSLKPREIAVGIHRSEYLA